MSIRSALFLLPALSLYLGAATLYDDDFSHGLAGWQILSGGDFDTSSSGSVFRADYADPYLGVAARTATFHDFTWTIDVRSLTGSFSNIGIGFCIQNDLDGYYFTVDSAKTFRIIMLSAGGTTFLANLPDSRISSGVNRLSVSRRGSATRFFCNGALLAAMDLSDPALDTGRVGVMLAGPNASVEFDNALVTDAFTAIPAQACVAESFGAGARDRWFTGLADATAKFVFDAPGGLDADARMVNDVQSPVFVNGAFSGLSLQGVMTWAEGDDSAAYGLCFVEVVQLPGFAYTYRSFTFLVNASRQYGIVRPDSQNIEWQQEPSPLLHGSGSADTLAVVTIGGAHVFMANGDTLIRALVRTDFAYEGAGFILSPGVRVRCASFAAAPGASFVCRTQPMTVLRARETPGASSLISVDAMGRILRVPELRGSRWDGTSATSPGSSGGVSTRVFRLVR